MASSTTIFQANIFDSKDSFFPVVGSFAVLTIIKEAGYPIATRDTAFAAEDIFRFHKWVLL